MWLGTEAKVPLTVDKDLVVTIPRKARKDMKVSVTYDKPIPAPIKKGDQVGKVVIAAPDVQPMEVPLYAAASVDRMGVFGRVAVGAGSWIWGSRH